MNSVPGENDGCECLDCQIEGGLIHFDLDELLCWDHGEAECPLCTHGAEAYDC